jgi:hypothetical protein
MPYKIMNAITGQEMKLRNNKHLQWGESLMDEEDYIEEVRFSKKIEAFNCIVDNETMGQIFQIVDVKSNNVITVSL